MSTGRISRSSQKTPGKSIVPVYWMHRTAVIFICRPPLRSTSPEQREPLLRSPRLGRVFSGQAVEVACRAMWLPERHAGGGEAARRVLQGHRLPLLRGIEPAQDDQHVLERLPDRA